MDIEEFYSADERRRRSAEVEFGNNWFDAKGSRYELSWVEDTGELYAMLELIPEADTLDAVRRHRGRGRQGRLPAGDRARRSCRPVTRSRSCSTAGPTTWPSPTASTGWPTASGGRHRPAPLD